MEGVFSSTQHVGAVPFQCQAKLKPVLDSVTFGPLVLGVSRWELFVLSNLLWSVGEAVLVTRPAIRAE